MIAFDIKLCKYYTRTPDESKAFFARNAANGRICKQTQKTRGAKTLEMQAKIPPGLPLASLPSFGKGGKKERAECCEGAYLEVSD